MLFGFTYKQIAVLAGVFLLSTLVSFAVVVTYLLAISDDHFIASDRGMRRRLQSRFSQIAWAILKNLLGVALVVIGLVLALPGVPGQGLLTILVGLLMLDIPGKRRLELAIVRRGPVLRTINKLRARFKRPPLRLQADDPRS